MSGVVLSGDCCLNIIFRIENPLQRGANQDITKVVRRPGGNALVTSLALSRWGFQSTFFGVMGNDPEGDSLRSWMRKAGVDSAGVVSRNLPTRISYVILDDNDRTILDLRGPSRETAELTLADWERTPAGERAFREADAVMLDRYCAAIHGPVKEIIQSRRKHGERPVLAYRTGSRPSAGFQIEEGILPAADIVFTKEVYLNSLKPDSGPAEGCRWYSEQHGIPLVVATAGTKGAAYYDSINKEGGLVPAFKVERPETTLGGGDFFRAGFLSAYLEGRTFPEMVRSGNAAAAVHISRPESEDFPSLFFPQSDLKRALSLHDGEVL